MSKNRIGIILLLLLLTVGFATVTANLIINNNANISSNPDDFSVIFYSASTDELSSAVISDDKKVITYNTKELVEVGDKSILEYEVKNNSFQYDADIDMNIIIPDPINNYIRITYEGFNNIDTTNILAKEIKAGKITIELIKPVIEDMEISIVVELNANAIERESIAYDTYTVRFNPNGGTGEMDEQTVYFDSLTNLSSNQFVKDGYQLLGWSINSDSSSVDYLNGEQILNITPSHTTKDLYAVWMKSEYPYKGNYDTFTAPVNGKYRIELWGAQGNSSYGNGAYTSGEIELSKDDILYVYVGQFGGSVSNSYAFNGGGPSSSSASSYNTYNGGGATDVRLISGSWNNTSSLRSRIMVAAGGGGVSHGGDGGYGGGLSGYNGLANAGYSGGNAPGYGASQTSGGSAGTFRWDGSAPTAGSFGYGGRGNSSYGGGGGGGYYGGGGSGVFSYSNGGGGSGSSFISGHQGCNAINSSGTHTGQPNHYSNLVFTNTKMIDGAGYQWTNTKGSRVGQVQPDGTVSTYGRTGNGYARITFVE